MICVPVTPRTSTDTIFGGSKMTRLKGPKSEARRVESRGQRPKAEAVNEDEFLGGGLAGAEQD